ncbi:MAG: LAGLIDADG family homing endonuclease [Candidatus Micrarchaeia archaeon]
MNIGEGIRKALAKITGKAIIDESAVKSMIKEIQRALILSDVNIELVYKLSKQIENRSLNEKPPAGRSMSEHIHAIVYEELTKIMGEGRKLELKPQKIMMCGLFGSGKCIHGDSLIPLCEGNVMPIKQVYKQIEKNGNKEVLIDGYMIRPNKEFEVYSFDPNTMKIKKTRIEAAWKLYKDELIEVSLDNGNDHKILVTPEHPFYTLEDGMIKEVRAEDLQIGQFVAVPRNLPFDDKRYVDMWDEIITNTNKDIAIVDKGIALQIREQLLRKYGTLMIAYQKLKIRGAYCTFTANLKWGIVPIELLRKCIKYGVKISKPTTLTVARIGRAGPSKKIKFPLIFSEEFSEFLGYLYAEGYIRKEYLEMTNVEPELIERFSYLVKKLFDIKPRIKRDIRRSRLKRVIVSSKLLVYLLKIIFKMPLKNKSRKISSPIQLLKSPNNILISFIKAYFDSDGWVGDNTRSIEISTASKRMAEELRYMLLRLNIFSGVSRKTINNTSYYRVYIRGWSAERFSKIILPTSKKKEERLRNMIDIGKGQTPGKFELIPVGRLLKETREGWGATIGEIQEHVNSYGNYERNGVITRKSLKKFLECLPKLKRNWMTLMNIISNHGNNYEEIIENARINKAVANAFLFRLSQLGYVKQIPTENGLLFMITTTGKEKVKAVKTFDENYKILRLLSESNVCWIRVAGKKHVKNKEKFVYDLTIKEYHNFIANNMIVHNTTQIGKIAHYLKKRGMSVGVIAADMMRPAAYEQLEQLSKQVGCNFYGRKGEGVKAKDVVKEGIEKLKNDVIIIDTSGRDALDDELIAELREINEVAKPDERILVISADIGQVAKKQAEEFNNAVELTGVIITKMDGSGKGGGALTACATAGVKVIFIGVGEKIGDIEEFNPSKFVGRLLGVPDFEALIEKVKAAVPEGMEEMPEEFTIETFYKQLKAARNMGPLKGLFETMGMVNVPKEVLDQGEQKMDQYESIIDSMTKAERKNPDLVRKSPSRIERISKGSGVPASVVKEFITQFGKMKKMYEQLQKNKGMQRNLQRLFKGKGFGF